MTTPAAQERIQKHKLQQSQSSLAQARRDLHYYQNHLIENGYTLDSLPRGKRAMMTKLRNKVTRLEGFLE